MPNLNKFALLLVGDPKSRKTSLCVQFPKPLIIDCDNNLDGVLRFYPKLEVKRFVVDYDEKDNKVPLQLRWPRFLKLLEDNWKDPWAETFIIDSMTKVRSYLCDYIVEQASSQKDLVIGGLKMMTQSHWGPYATMIQRMVSDLRRIPKYVIVTAHVSKDKDESTGRWLFKPSIGGQSENTIAGLFTDVWYAGYTVGADGVKYNVRTEPTPQMTLGNSLGLPPNYEFSWPEFQKRMEAFK